MRSSQSADLVAAVPYLLGFHPRDSLVVVVMQAEGRSRLRSGPLARLDLAEFQQAPTQAGETLRRVLSQLMIPRVAALVLLAYHEGPHDDPGPHRPAVELAENIARDWVDGLPVQVFSVGGRAWACLDCPGCCPSDGYPLDDLAQSPVAASFVADGYAPALCRDGLAVSVVPDVELRTRVAGALVRASAERDQQVESRSWRTSLARRWDSALAAQCDPATPIDPDQMGQLLGSLQDVHLRDAVVAAALAGYAVADIESASQTATAAARAELHGPDSEVTRATMALMTELAACAPPHAAAAPLATAAYLAWWLGEGARADVLAQQSLQMDPDYRLAALVMLAVEGGMPPPWVAPRSSRPTPIR